MLMIEYAVVQTAPGEPIIVDFLDTIEAAEKKVAWLYSWKEDRRKAAERETKQEEEGQVLQGNWERYAWNRGNPLSDGPIKDREWAISKREVGEWERVNW
jgi:hypothetical protein